jgi:tetraacyldisaccharide 4'-kinase
LALAGIAKPAQFFDMLRERGVLISDTWVLPDHHMFNEDAIFFAPQTSHQQWLCTEKDSVKLFPIWRNRHKENDPFNPPALWAVPLELSIDPEFFVALNKKLSSLHGHSTS